MPFTLEGFGDRVEVTFTGLTYQQVLAHLEARRTQLTNMGWKIDHIHGTQEIVVTLLRVLGTGEEAALTAVLS